MAKKVKCPGCGARNPAGQHRCRVCTTVIDPSADEGLPKGLAKQRKLDERLDAARRRQQPEDAAAPAADDGFDVPVGPAAPDVTVTPAAAVAEVATVAAVAPPSEPIVPEVDPPSELPADAIVIDAAPRHVADPVAPVAADDAGGWDTVGGIEIDVVSRNASAPPPIEYDGSFDPDDLVIDPPR
jgi:hypothetical protein